MDAARRWLWFWADTDREEIGTFRTACANQIAGENGCRTGTSPTVFLPLVSSAVLVRAATRIRVVRSGKSAQAEWPDKKSAVILLRPTSDAHRQPGKQGYRSVHRHRRHPSGNNRKDCYISETTFLPDSAHFPISRLSEVLPEGLGAAENATTADGSRSS